MSLAVESVRVSAYIIPTDSPESDGTLEWSSTTLVVVEVSGGGETGLGYTYADTATATLVRDTLVDVVCGRDAMNIPSAWVAMSVALRNHGRPGICAMAMSAVDVALWDLKSKLLGLSLVSLLGAVRASVPAYASGGFTSYTDTRLAEQLGAWAGEGFTRVKLKVGREPGRDLARVAIARAAVGRDVDLLVDANGAYTAKQALGLAEGFAEYGVRWFEEPVSSDHLEQLHLLRQRAPAGMDIAAGEYGYDLFYFRRMLDAGAVDVLQADGSRCGGISSFVRVASLCEASGLHLSSHCAPTLHAHVDCALIPVCHMEYFHDHVRIEQRLFEGALRPIRGEITPDVTRPGLGIVFKRADAAPYAV